MKITRGFLRTGIMVGTLLMLGPVLGLLGTMFGMMHAFGNLGSAGIGDPKALSNSISITLFSTVAGLVMFPCGAVLLTVCLVLLYQSPPDERGTRPEARGRVTEVPPPLPPRE